jgi:hypothetical protein
VREVPLKLRRGIEAFEMHHAELDFFPRGSRIDPFDSREAAMRVFSGELRPR